MTSEVLTRSSLYGRTMSPALTEAILNLAIDTRARVHIGWSGRIGDALVGTLAGGDDRSLHITIPEIEELRADTAKPQELEMTVIVSSGRYLFTTSPLDPPPLSSTEVLLVARPTTLTALDRRRSRRRNLRPPSTVVLRLPDERDAWRCAASILNVSADGLACLLENADAQRVPVGRNIVTEFQVNALEETFQMTGRVVNSTRAGTPEHVVLGVEFLAEEASTPRRVRLRDVLTGQSD